MTTPDIGRKGDAGRQAMLARMAKAERALRQVPSRWQGRTGARLLGRVRWNQQFGSDNSEAELVSINGVAISGSRLVWIERATSIDPPYFGDTVYELEFISIAVSRSAVTRPLYRAIRYVSGGLQGDRILHQGANTLAYGKIVSSAGSAIQTTIAGVAGDNNLTYLHTIQLKTAGEAQLQRPAQYLRSSSTVAIATAAKVAGGERGGKTLSPHNGSTQVTTPTARIDHGEPWSIKGTLSLTRTMVDPNPIQERVVSADFEIYFQSTNSEMSGIANIWCRDMRGSQAVSGANITDVDLDTHSGPVFPTTDTEIITYGSTLVFTFGSVSAREGAMADIQVSVVISASGSITSVRVEAVNINASYTSSFLRLFTINGGGT